MALNGRIALVLAALFVGACAQSCAVNGGITAPAGSECAWEGSTSFNGTVVSTSANTQTSAANCCTSCKNHTGDLPCNVWSWCGEQGGCCTEKAGCTSDSTLAPYHSCTLMFDEGLEYADESPTPSLVYNASDVAAWGPGQLSASAALTSGVALPTLVDAEPVDGYTTLPSQDISSGNYLCSGSLYEGAIIKGCRLNGTLAELAAGCSADRKCTAFSYQPYGCCTSTRLNNNLYESGWRKTGTINENCTTFLPHTTTYVKASASSA